MDDEAHVDADLQKCISEGPMDTDEGPLINENSNGLSHLLTEGEFNSVDAVGVDESSASNQAFLNAVELSTGSVGDYLENDNQTFNAGSFDVGDNAVQFPSDSLNNVLSDGDSRLSDSAFKNNTVDADGDVTESQAAKMETEPESEVSNDMNNLVSGEDITQENQNETEEVKESPDETEEVKENIDDDEAIPQENHNEDSMVTDDESMKVNASEDGDKSMKEDDSESQLAFIKNDEDSSLQPHIKNDEDFLLQAHTKNEEDSLLQDEEDDSRKVPEVGGAEETEVVSEDELPAVEKPKIKDAENVSDDELPGPKAAELPADTEVVSEDELPSSKKDTKVSRKRKTDQEGNDYEDELPAVEKPKIKDAENVSDDELPGPKPADLPADTEVVSEDELPSSKKDTKESRKRKTDQEGNDYDPQSPTSETESASKKQAVAKNGESKPVPAEKRSSTEEKPKKKLPELDKYWKVVNDDPTDFTGWTYLLQYVDQESDVEAAREAYDAFLSHYPYCYGYWRKYADYEKRKGSKKKCLDVLERGLKAIPLSVDLWIHYLNHVKSTRTEDQAYIRSQYERAIEACGLEFRSDRLWESYIKWEGENGDALHVTNIYDRLLATPTLGYTSHFDNFQEHIMSEPVKNVISNAELIKLRADVRAAGGPAPQLDLPPGEDEPPDNIASDEEGQSIKERIIAARRKVHKTTGEEVAARWTFEEGIKRPYFHVKPLERCQLKNWKSYLEWEKQHGTFKRALVLHERCLIACALYEEFWMRLIKFLEERAESDPELISVEREALERACTVHHLDKPELHLHWAHFEEAQGHATKAAEILERIEKTCPNLVQIQYRRVNLERRRGDHEKVVQLFELYISSAKIKTVASALAIKYARFLFHVKQDPPAARKVLDEAITKDPLNQRLHMQRLDLALHTPGTPFSELEELVQTYEKQEGSELEVSAEMAWRRRELAEELGDATAARAATLHQRALARHMRKRARKEKHDAPPPPSGDAKKKDSTATTNSTSTTTANSSTYYQTPPATAQSYDQQYPGGYQPGPWGYQQPPGPPYQHHPHAWPQYPNYY